VSRAFWTLTLLAARREWRERTRARSYRISLLILVLAVVLAVVIPALVSGSSHPARVGVVASGPRATTAAATVQRVGRVLDTRVTPVAVGSVPAARAQLRSGRLAVAYVPGGQVLIHQRPASGGDDTDLQLAQAIAQLDTSPAQSLPPTARALPVRAIEAPPTPLSTRLTGLAAAILIYLIVFTYGQRIVSGVVEEKATRVAEILLASMRPAQLLVGKVLGIGASALAQVLALLIAFVVAAEASGSNLLHGASIDVVLVAAGWLLLGYALHCTAFAAAGSMVSRESEATNVTFPVVLPLLLAYALSFTVIFGGSGSTFYHVLAFIPPCAPVASTTMYAVGAIGIGQVAISWAICLVATVLCARVAATIYERSILRTGPRVHLRDVFVRSS
jgi:ABC-2 type transport system permease protein